MLNDLRGSVQRARGHDVMELGEDLRMLVLDIGRYRIVRDEAFDIARCQDEMEDIVAECGLDCPEVLV